MSSNQNNINDHHEDFYLPPVISRINQQGGDVLENFLAEEENVHRQNQSKNNSSNPGSNTSSFAEPSRFTRPTTLASFFPEHYDTSNMDTSSVDALGQPLLEAALNPIVVAAHRQRRQHRKEGYADVRSGLELLLPHQQRSSTSRASASISRQQPSSPLPFQEIARSLNPNHELVVESNENPTVREGRRTNLRARVAGRRGRRRNGNQRSSSNGSSSSNDDDDTSSNSSFSSFSTSSWSSSSSTRSSSSSSSSSSSASNEEDAARREVGRQRRRERRRRQRRRHRHRRVIDLTNPKTTDNFLAPRFPKWEVIRDIPWQVWLSVCCAPQVTMARQLNMIEHASPDIFDKGRVIGNPYDHFGNNNCERECLTSNIHTSCFFAYMMDAGRVTGALCFPQGYGLLVAFSGTCCLVIATRNDIRKRFNIPGHSIQDVLMGYFCPLCAVIQQHEEFKLRGLPVELPMLRDPRPYPARMI